MTREISENFETVAPTEADALLALESSRRLANHKLGQRSSVMIQIGGNGENTESVAVPASALRLFVQLLAEMSHGNAVTLVPTHAELTTEQAADLLNVSPSYVVRLLDEGRIPSRTIGAHRRVRLNDLLNFKCDDDKTRGEILDQLTAEAQELGMGY